MTDADFDAMSTFCCGEDELDSFFRYEAKECVRHKFLASYCAVSNSGEIIAAFTLMNDAVILNGDTEKQDFFDDLEYNTSYDDRIFFKRQHTFPAINLGHLGVSKKHQHHRIGMSILSFIAATFSDYKQAGCQFLTVDAINKSNVTKFYCMNGFCFQTNRDFASSTRRMYRIL